MNLKYKLKSFCLILFLTPLLTSCSTGRNGETVMGLVESTMWFKTASRQTIIAHFSETCDSFGYKRGTDSFRDCLRETETASRSQSRANFKASSYRNNNSSTNDESSSLRRGLRTECIMDGGVFVGDRCMK